MIFVMVTDEQETDFNNVDDTARAQLQAGEATGTWLWGRTETSSAQCGGLMQAGHQMTTKAALSFPS